MKNRVLAVIGVLVLMLAGIYYGAYGVGNNIHKEYLRIHIRADSNDEVAQSVKYKVRDGVVEFLTPYIAVANTKEKAEKMLSSKLKDIENVADGVLKANGFSYTAHAYLNNEKFPTRVYDGVTLESGFYDALIIELGSGKGDNWWCVVYPPLCFYSENSNVVLKSKIKEIIDGFYRIHK